MKTKEDILTLVFEPDSQDCTTTEQDLQLAIILNPSLDYILRAMDEYAEQFKPLFPTEDQINLEAMKWKEAWLFKNAVNWLKSKLLE